MILRAFLVVFLLVDFAFCETISELVHRGAIKDAYLKAESLNTSILEKNDALFEAITMGTSDVVSGLIQRGAEVNDDTYKSICDAKHFHLLKILIRKKEPNASIREKLFFCAISQGASDSYELIVGKNGVSAEMLGKGLIQLIKDGAETGKLLEINPSLKIQDEDGKTALHLAVIREDKKLYDSILKSGGKDDIKDGNGKLAKDYIKELGLTW